MRRRKPGAPVHLAQAFQGAEGGGGPGHRPAQRGSSPRYQGRLSYFQPVQDLRIGGRTGNAMYQYHALRRQPGRPHDLGARVLERLRTLPALVDVNSDQQNKGLQATLVIDRNTASRLGITAQMIDNALYDAFGQDRYRSGTHSSTSTTWSWRLRPEYWQRPDTLRDIYVRGIGRRHGAPHRLHPFPEGRDLARRQPPGPVPRGHHLFQPGARQVPRRGGGRDRRGDAPDGHSRDYQGAASWARPRLSRRLWPTSRS